jgi:hypothetical protein
MSEDVLWADPVLLSLLNALSDDEPCTELNRREDPVAESLLLRVDGIPERDLSGEEGM